MRLRHDERYELAYLKNKYARVFIAGVFISFNMVTLVMYALPKVPGQLPRYYWPICSALVAGFAATYWILLQGLRGRLGKAIGYVIHVFETDDKEIPLYMADAMGDAQKDGTRRRVIEEVHDCHFGSRNSTDACLLDFREAC